MLLLRLSQVFVRKIAILDFRSVLVKNLSELEFQFWGTFLLIFYLCIFTWNSEFLTSKYKQNRHLVFL